MESAASSRDEDGWRLLDDRDEWMQFSRAAGDVAGVWESNVVFEGMRCAGCAASVERALKQTPGVLEAEVNAASHRGRVVWSDAATQPSAWMQAVARAGYRSLPVNDMAAEQRRRRETRKMMWRLGVAGVCMMQVMMYSVPTYIAPGDMTAPVVSLLRWAQLLLALPVLLFSCQPFFRNALLDLKTRRISMDLPVALGMFITFMVSALGTLQPDGVFGRQVYFDSMTMFVFFMLTGRWLELRMRDRTAGALEALMHRLPDSVLRRTAAGAWQRVSVRQLRPGDVLQVLAGEVFPADGLLLEGESSVDEALLTGESRPVLRRQGQTVIAGSHNLQAPVHMRVQCVGGDTRYAQIVSLMEQAAISKPSIARLADKIAGPFLLFVILAATAACLFWWPRSDPAHALMIAVAVLVITCPCALSLATPAAMLASAGALARKGVLVRQLQALETLSGINHVVFDKTGTLTRDAFVLYRVKTRAGVTRAQALSLAAALAQASLHPVSRALLETAEHENAGPRPELDDVHEIMGQGVQARLRGQAAGELRLGSAAFCAVPVSADADGPVSHLSDAQGWLASFYLHEDLRSDARQTVAELQAHGLKTSLLSGDRPQAVARVARLAGIDDAHGDCLPDDKLAWLHQLQEQGAKLAMVGDGLNDGPVLAGADASFAFASAVPLARARSDFVVLADKLALVAETQVMARRAMRIVKQNLTWAACYNMVGIPAAMMGFITPWIAGIGMACSSLFVVLNALRLAAEGKTTEVH